MVADLWRQTAERTESGQNRIVWSRDTDNPTIGLIARPILGGGIRVVGSMERFDEEYLPIDWIKFQTDVELSKRYRLFNIRDRRTGKHLWEDNEAERYVTNPDTGVRELVWESMWFDIVGVMPIVDPFGRLLEYDSLAKKVANLNISSIVGYDQRYS